MNSSELVSLNAVWRGYSEYSSSCFHCRNEFIRSSFLLATLIYPCHSAGGTVWALVLGNFHPGLSMPSADSHYAIISPCGSLTRPRYLSSHPLSLCSSPIKKQAHGWFGCDDSSMPGFCSTGFPIIRYICNRNRFRDAVGLPGYSSATFSARLSDIRGLAM